MAQLLPFVISEKSHEVAKRHGLWPVSFTDFVCHFESRGREEEARLGGKWGRAYA